MPRLIICNTIALISTKAFLYFFFVQLENREESDQIISSLVIT